MAQPVYHFARHFVEGGVVETFDHEDDYMGIQEAAAFFDSSLFSRWERTPDEDYRGTRGPVETYQLDITR